MRRRGPALPPLAAAFLLRIPPSAGDGPPPNISLAEQFKKPPADR